MGLQATHLRMRRCNLKSSQLLLLLAHLSPPGAGVQVWGGGGWSVSRLSSLGEGRQEPQPTWSCPPPPEPEGGTPQDPWTLPNLSLS